MTEAVMNNANAEMGRHRQLLSPVLSRAKNMNAIRGSIVARAKYREASEHHSLVDDHAREEDQAMAEADLRLAKANLRDQGRWEEAIGSPIDGTVLRKHHRNGESVARIRRRCLIRL